MKILNLLTCGDAGGIERLCEMIGINSNYDNVFCFIRRKGIIYEDMKAHNLHVEDCSIGGNLSIRKLIKLCKLSATCDIIVTHHFDIFLQVYFILLHIFNPHKKYVMTIHSCFENKNFSYRSKIKGKLNYIISTYAMKIADSCIYVSEAGQRSWESEFKTCRGKGRVVYNGIDPKLLEEGRCHVMPSIDNNQYKMLYVGRLSHVKGVHNLIDAMKVLQTKYDVVLKIVGDGEERENLEKQAIENGLGNRIEFVGQVTDPIPYLKEANIFIYPSIWQEVFGISIVEAMAMGLVVVSNRVGGIPEIIEDGVNGYLADELNVDALAAAIEKGINCFSNDTYKVIQKQAKTTAGRFSGLRTVAELSTQWERLLKEDGKCDE